MARLRFRAALIFAVIFVILFSAVFGSTANSDAGAQTHFSSLQPAPSPCFPNGPVEVFNATVWSNLQCVHQGNIVINGTGSLTLINSQLMETSFNGTIGNVTVAGDSVLTFEDSVLNLNSSGVLSADNNGSLVFSGSSVQEGRMVSGGGATLESNQSSSFNLWNFTMENFTTARISGSVVSLYPGAELNANGSTILLQSSSLSESNSPSGIVSPSSLQVLNSTLDLNNVSSVVIRILQAGEQL